MLMFEENVSNIAGSFYSTREPYRTSVEKVDIDTMRTDSLMAFISLRELKTENVLKLKKFSDLIMSDICISFKNGPLNKYAETYKAFTEWAISWRGHIQKETLNTGSRTVLLQELSD